MEHPPGTERVRRWPQRLALTLIFVALVALGVFLAVGLGRI